MDPNEKLSRLRTVITENLRVQRSGAEGIPYIDVTNALSDVVARQNHTIFARRGCGKTLLLSYSAQAKLPPGIKVVYLNCEDFKNHSFPNVLVEILDAVFAELHKNLTGWFGRKRQSKAIIAEIRRQLAAFRQAADAREEHVKEATAQEKQQGAEVNVSARGVGSFGAKTSDTARQELERTYTQSSDKLSALNLWLPELKTQIREFFSLSSSVKAVFVQVDDFYHLRRVDQPFVMDYIHRLCKDVPLYFKIATLRHASVLYADRKGQPTGAQAGHDYQSIDIDFTFVDFQRTERQVRRILHEFGRLAGMSADEVDGIFKGEGFKRLVMAGGGVPRDCLSLFLEVLDKVQQDSDGRIGKDDVRTSSRTNFEHRIQELKQDSEGPDQDSLLTGIYVVREFCLDEKRNVFFVSEQELQREDKFRELIFRLLDYRIIHTVGTALTHKSQSGSYHAFAIDVGCYAHMRTLDNRFTEFDVAHPDFRERVRSSPILRIADFEGIWGRAPENVEQQMLADDDREVA